MTPRVCLLGLRRQSSQFWSELAKTETPASENRADLNSQKVIGAYRLSFCYQLTRGLEDGTGPGLNDLTSAIVLVLIPLSDYGSYSRTHTTLH